MHYTLGTDLVEAGRVHTPAVALSISICCEDGREYHTALSGWEECQLTGWQRSNPRLIDRNGKSLEEAAITILSLIGNDTPTFWLWEWEKAVWELFRKIMGSRWPSTWPDNFCDLNAEMKARELVGVEMKFKNTWKGENQARNNMHTLREFKIAA